MKDDERFKKPLVDGFNAVFSDARARLRIERTNERNSKQEARVKGLVREMKAYERDDRARRQAEIAIANGNDSDVELAALGPTPEQLAKVEFVPVEALRVEGWQGRTVMTVRRQDVPVAYKMMMKGIIDSNGYAACVWYRNSWESSGMMGNIPSTDYTKEVFAGPTSRSQLTDSQMEIADCLRFVVSRINARHSRLLYATVIQDIPIHRAVRYARAFRRNAIRGFRDAVVQLVDAKKDYEGA